MTLFSKYTPRQQRVLSLYRQILKLGYDWEKYAEATTSIAFHKSVYEKQYITKEQDHNDYSKCAEEVQKEKQYIVDETRKLFREYKNLTNDEEIASKIDLAEKRLLITQHYGIPFERPEHINIYDTYWKGELDQSFEEQNANVTTDQTQKLHVLRSINPLYDSLERTEPTQEGLSTQPSYRPASDNHVTVREIDSEEDNWK